jgi:PAS domain S-box-containing protein
MQPLVYVNASFEKMTGYDRREILGHNCRFLQYGNEAGHVSEVDSVKRLTAALKEGKAVKVAITNFRKDGTPFRNLLAMKPIFDTDGNYAFVLGMQFDIGDEDACPIKVKMIDDLFRVLPDTVVGGVKEPTDIILRRSYLITNTSQLP